MSELLQQFLDAHATPEDQPEDSLRLQVQEPEGLQFPTKPDLKAFNEAHAEANKQALRDRANQLVKAYKEGQISLPDEWRDALIDTAYEGSSPGQTAKDYAAGIGAAVSDPWETLKNVTKLGGSAVETVAKGVKEQVTTPLSSLANTVTGAYKGIASTASLGEDFVQSVLAPLRTGETTIKDPVTGTTKQRTDRTQDIINAANVTHNIAMSGKAVASALGHEHEAPASEAIGEFGGQAIPFVASGGIGGALGVAEKAAPKVAEAVIEKAIPKTVGAGMRVAGSPITAAALTTAAGHPYAALGELAAAYAPKGIKSGGVLDWLVAKPGQFIKQMTLDKVDDLGQKLMQVPNGMTIARKGQLDLVEEIAKNQKAEQVFTLSNKIDQDALKSMDNEQLKALGYTKELKVKELQAQRAEMQSKYDRLDKWNQLGMLSKDIGKLGISVGITATAGGATMAGFSAMSAIPDDVKEASKQGFTMGVALTAPAILPVGIATLSESKAGRLKTEGDFMQGRGNKYLSNFEDAGVMSSQIPKDMRRRIDITNGAIGSSGQHVLAAEPSILRGKLGLSPEAEVPNGYYDKSIGTAYVNADALRNGVWVQDHEVGHVIDQVTEGAMSKAYSSIMDGINNPDGNTLGSLVDFLSNYGAAEKKTDPDAPPLSNESLIKEGAAELSRYILARTPMEQIFGGKDIWDVLSDKIKRAKQSLTGESNEIFKVPGFDAPAQQKQSYDLTKALYDYADKAQKGLIPPSLLKPAPTLDPAVQTQVDHALTKLGVPKEKTSAIITQAARMANNAKDPNDVLNVAWAIAQHQKMPGFNLEKPPAPEAPESDLKPTPQIMSPAVYAPGWEKPVYAFAHEDAMKKAKEMGLDTRNADKGFYTLNGTFLPTKQALDYGQDIGQLPHDMKKLTDYGFQGTREFMPSSHPEAIKEAAIKMGDGEIFGAGVWGLHGHAIDAAEKAGYGTKDWPNAIEGYVDKKGKFYDRDQAFQHAEKIGQVSKNAPALSEKYLESDAFERSRQFMPSVKATPEVKKFLGKSELTTDKEGNPIVMFHTSRAGKDFSTFDKSKNKSLGFHFGNIDQANWVADAGDSFLGAKYSNQHMDHLLEGRKGTRTYPVILRLENPLQLRSDLGFTMPESTIKALIDDGYIGTPLQAEHRKAMGVIQNKKAYGLPPVEETPDYKRWEKYRDAEIAKMDHPVSGPDPWKDHVSLDDERRAGHMAIERILKEDGYDGFVYPNEFEGAEKGRTSYAVFDANQIKSAMSNTGEYSREKPEINLMPGTKAEVNVGLDVRDGKPLAPNDVVKALKDAGVDVTRFVVDRPKGEEAKVIATLSQPLTKEQGDAVAKALHQDAIPQHVGGGKGEMFGAGNPEHPEWNEFNPDYFTQHNGKSVTDNMAAGHDGEPIKEGQTGSPGMWDTMMHRKDLGEELGVPSDKRFYEQKPDARKKITDHFRNKGEAQFMPSSHPEAIKGAAVMDADGKIWEGSYHGAAIGRAQMAHAPEIPDYLDPTWDVPYDVGFVDNSGGFRTREEALVIGKRYNQLEPDFGGYNDESGENIGGVVHAHDFKAQFMPKAEREVPDRFYAEEQMGHRPAIIDRLTGKVVDRWEGPDAGEYSSTAGYSSPHEMAAAMNEDMPPLPRGWTGSHPDAFIPEIIRKHPDGTWGIEGKDGKIEGKFDTSDEANAALKEAQRGAANPESPQRIQLMMPKTKGEADVYTEKSKTEFPEALPVTFKKDKEGKYKTDPRTKELIPDEINYGLSETPMAQEVSKDIKDKEAAREAMAHKYADETAEAYHSIKDDPEIMGAQGWYADARNQIKNLFGDHSQTFAQLLAATSPNTEVSQNFNYALQVWNKWRRGDYDEMIGKFEDAIEKYHNGELYHGNGTKVEGAKSFENYLNHHDIVLRQDNGKRIGMHSLSTMYTLTGRFKEKLKGLKINQFAANLSGDNLEATIDMWAARWLRRAGNKGNDGRWRILPANEKGVTEPDFALAQRSFRLAADKLGMSPDDLQAIMWFAEKKHYDQQGWSRSKQMGDFRTPLKKLRPAPGKEQYEVAPEPFQ